MALPSNLPTGERGLPEKRWTQKKLRYNGVNEMDDRPEERPWTEIVLLVATRGVAKISGLQLVVVGTL